MIDLNRINVKNAKRIFQNPKAITGEFDRQMERLNSAYHNRFVENSGEHVMDADWDNLVILDACRFDLFQEVYTTYLSGDLQSKSSLGSCTLEFLQENFYGKNFHDTVYVSSNPHTSSIDDGTFHCTRNLFLSHWDKTYGTVHPEDMTEQGLAAFEEFPNKRIIIHYMQPHEPFIGDFSDDLPQTGLERKKTKKWGDLSIWTNLRYRIKDTTLNKVVRAYRANLELALSYVNKLVGDLEGKTVVTSDHGNLLGERLYPIPVRGYGHPWYIRSEPLVKVPWLKIEGNSRRNIHDEEPVQQSHASADIIEKRLRSLGYK
jgi:hypothetical protein